MSVFMSGASSAFKDAAPFFASRRYYLDEMKEFHFATDGKENAFDLMFYVWALPLFSLDFSE